MSETPRTRSIAVSGAKIYIEFRVSGPVLLLIPGGGLCGDGFLTIPKGGQRHGTDFKQSRLAFI